ALQRQVETFVDGLGRRGAVTERQILELDDHPPGPGRDRERQPHRAANLLLRSRSTHLLHLLDAALDLAGLRGLGPEAVDELLRLGSLASSVALGSLSLLGDELPLGEERLVVALVGDEL